MWYLIGYMTAGLVVGILGWGMMVDDHRISMLWTSVWGILGALFAGWAGLMLGWYTIGFGLGLFVATLGALASVWIFSAVYHQRHRSDQLLHH